MGKLEACIALRRQGWARVHARDLRFYTVASEKTFSLDGARPRFYFLALLDVDSILDLFPARPDDLPCILHGM
eukprot:9879330-Lingulodinium_polyedra.AAC.1